MAVPVIVTGATGMTGEGEMRVTGGHGPGQARGYSSPAAPPTLKTSPDALVTSV